MKIKLGAILLLLFFGGCGFWGNSPTSVVGKYLKLSEKNQNIEALEKLFSERAKRELGEEKILVDVLSAVYIGTQIASTGESTPFLKPEETINGDFATVTFYINPTWAANNDKNNQAKALLVKENGEWKIYAFGQSGEPNPNLNSIYATEIAKAYRSYPDLVNTRLIGKTIVVEGEIETVGINDDNDAGSLFIKTGFNGSSEGFGLCKLNSGANALYETTKKTGNKKIKVKGTITAKVPSDRDTVFVLDNCTVQ